MSDPVQDASEKVFMDAVIQIALTCGWDAHHIKPAKYGDTWKTDGLPGMPDLILIGQRGQGIIWAELKTRTGKLTDMQERRIVQLMNNGEECYVWRPNDTDAIVARLSKRV
jgi:hypothetical protein